MEKNKIKITLDYEEYSTLIENFQRLIAKEWESESPDKEWISTLQFYISDFELNAGEPNSDYDEYELELEKTDVEFFIHEMIHKTKLSIMADVIIDLSDNLVKLQQEENCHLENENKLLRKICELQEK